MKIYNEKEHSKLQKVNSEEKRSTRKWNGAKFCVQGDKWIKKWNKGSGDLRARSHPIKFPTEWKKIQSWVWCFNPSSREAEAGGSLEFEASLVYRVPGQPCLGSERNNQKPRIGEDVIEQGEQEGHVPTPVSSRTWQLRPHGSGFRVKDRRKGF